MFDGAAGGECYHRADADETADLDLEMSLSLTEIRRQPEERRMRLSWSDGHSADFDYDYVRGYCPCASCQGHGAFKIEFHPPEKPVDLASIQPVGNYGVSFAWTDGHATGIYRFDFLRSICPCEECVSKRPESDIGEPVSEA